MLGNVKEKDESWKRKSSALPDGFFVETRFPIFRNVFFFREDVKMQDKNESLETLALSVQSGKIVLFSSFILP